MWRGLYNGLVTAWAVGDVWGTGDDGLQGGGRYNREQSHDLDFCGALTAVCRDGHADLMRPVGHIQDGKGGLRCRYADHKASQ